MEPDSNLVLALRALLGGPDGDGLSAAWLFGSAANRRTHAGSDVDVAIVPERPMTLGAELALQARLARACERAVDLVRLDLADAVLRWEVARAGVVLLSRPAGAAARIVAEIALEHADLAPLLEEGAERWRRAILARGRAQP